MIFAGKGEKGSGDGLFIVKSNVAMNDGTISVKSKEGNGTTFSIEFPTSHHIDTGSDA